MLLLDGSVRFLSPTLDHRFAQEKLDEKRAAKEQIQQLRAEFGNYMAEGERLAREWRAGMREYGAWFQRRQGWVQRVSDFLTNMGLPDEAAAFRHAGEGDPDVNQLQGVNQAIYWHRFYGVQTDRWRTKLAEIAARRLDLALSKPGVIAVQKMSRLLRAGSPGPVRLLPAVTDRWKKPERCLRGQSPPVFPQN